MQQPDKQREAFESWWFNGDYSPSPCKRMSICDEGAFEIWQAAQQELQAPLRMVDPVSQAMGLINDWNEGAADDEDWGNEACQAMFALSDCIKTLLIEAGTQAQWQPIESNLPSCKESAIEYLVFDTLNNKVGHDYWMVPDDGGEPFWNHYGEYVSHWMPLPQEPNVVD